MSTCGEERQAPGAIVFDLDGTLIDSGLTIVAIINQMRQFRRYAEVAPDQVWPHLSKGGERLVALSLGEAAADSVDDLADFRSRYHQIVQGPEIVYDRVAVTLQDLSASGWRLAICTNKPRSLTDNALAQTGLGRFFSTVVAGGDGYASKPDPASLLECCRRLGSPPVETWFVGDSEVDQETAASAGCGFLFVEYGYPVGDPNVIPCHGRLSAFHQMPALLARLPYGPTVAS